MTVSYIDHIFYTNSPEGLETASLLGNSLRLSSAVVAGATSLPIMPAGSGGTSTNTDVSQFDLVTIYDGLNSEQVMVASDTTFPASSITLLAPGCVYAHAQYTPCSSKGVMGDLGTEILKASAWLENITRQSLWSTSQTEVMNMPSMRASIDNQQILRLRTKQYPITAVTALTIQTNTSDAIAYDATQAFIDANESISVPQLITTGSGSSTYSIITPQVSRQMNAYVSVTYTAGYTSATMPMDVKDAAVLLTSALIARRLNPAGADGYDLGDRRIQATQRGDASPDSLLVKTAKGLLSNYTLRIF